jgi:hypothetical protein
MDAQPPGRPPAIMTRRRVLSTSAAVGAAAASMAGGAAVTEAVVSPRRRGTADATAVRHAMLLAAQGTTVESAAIAPAVVHLTDASTITVDASLGNDYRVTLAASRTMGNPANATNGQQIIFQVTQGSSGSAAITWGSGYEFSSALPQPGLSTQPGQTDLLGFVYNGAKGTWLLAAFVNGFG